MKNTKILSWLLSASLLASSLPMFAFQASAVEEPTKEVAVEEFTDADMAGESATLTYMDEKLSNGEYNKYIKIDEIGQNSNRAEFKTGVAVANGESYVLSFKIRSYGTASRQIRAYVNGSNILLGHKYDITDKTVGDITYTHGRYTGTWSFGVDGKAQSYDTGVTISAADDYGWQKITIPFTVGQNTIALTEDDLSTETNEMTDTNWCFKVNANANLTVGISGGTSWNHCAPYEIDDLELYMADDLTDELTGLGGYQDYGSISELSAYVTYSAGTSGIAELVKAEPFYRLSVVDAPSDGAKVIPSEPISAKAGDVFIIKGHFRLAQYPTPSAEVTFTPVSGTATTKNGSVGDTVESYLRTVMSGSDYQPQRTAQAIKAIQSEYWREISVVSSIAPADPIQRSLGPVSPTTATCLKATDEWTYGEFTYTVSADSTIEYFKIRGSTSGADTASFKLYGADGTTEVATAKWNYDNRRLGFDYKGIEIVQVVSAVPEPGYVANSVDFDISADAANVNPGDEVTVKIIASTQEADKAQQIGALTMALDYDASKFTYKDMTFNLPYGEKEYVIIENVVDEDSGSVRLGFMEDTTNDSSVKPQLIFKDYDALVATATFVVKDTAVSGSAAFTLPNTDVVLIGDPTYNGYVIAERKVNVNVHNITVTVDGTNLKLGNIPTTLYALYNEAGLYSDSERTNKVSLDSVTAADGYRLEGSWKLNGSAYDAAHKFTENGTLTHDTVRVYTVTLASNIADGITFPNKVLTVDAGTVLEDALAGKYSVHNFYRLDGWKIGDADADLTAVVSDDITVTAQLTAQDVGAVVSVKDTGDAEASVTGGGAVIDVQTVGENLVVDPVEVDGYKVTAVKYTKSDADTEIPLVKGDNGKWTSSEKLAGAVSVTVYYTKVFKISFVTAEGSGAVIEPVDYYALDGSAGLYTDAECEKKAASIPAIVYEGADGSLNYKWDPEFNSTPYTMGGENYSASDLIDHTFTSSATVTANGIKSWKITFIAGTNVTFSGETKKTVVVWVPDGSDITCPKLVTPTDYYKTSWDITPPEKAETYGTYTVSAVPETYSFSITSAGVENVSTTGVSDKNEVTHGNDVSITVTSSNAPTVVIKVAGVTKEISAAGSGNVYTYTITGSDIIGAVEVTVTSQIAVVFSPYADDAGADFEAKTYLINPGDTLADKLDEIAALPVPAAGYKFVGWFDAQGKAVSVDASNVFNASVTYYAKFEKCTYSVTTENSGLALSHETAEVGDNITVTPGEKMAVLTIEYKIGEDGEFVTVFPDKDGEFVIPGSAVVGDITVKVGDELNVGFVSKKSESEGKCYSVLATGTVMVKIVHTGENNVTYKLSNELGGDTLYYSNKYGAYVTIVADGTTASDIARGITVTAGTPAPEVNYNGDISGNNVVNSGDAALLSVLLHNYDGNYSDIVRLRADVYDDDGESYVTTADCKWILREVVGLN